jgi:hypothetical protein
LFGRMRTSARRLWPAQAACALRLPLRATERERRWDSEVGARLARDATVVELGSRAANSRAFSSACRRTRSTLTAFARRRSIERRPPSRSWDQNGTPPTAPPRGLTSAPSDVVSDAGPAVERCSPGLRLLVRAWGAFGGLRASAGVLAAGPDTSTVLRKQASSVKPSDDPEVSLAPRSETLRMPDSPGLLLARRAGSCGQPFRRGIRRF